MKSPIFNVETIHLKPYFSLQACPRLHEQYQAYAHDFQEYHLGTHEKLFVKTKSEFLHLEGLRIEITEFVFIRPEENKKFIRFIKFCEEKG